MAIGGKRKGKLRLICALFLLLLALGVWCGWAVWRSYHGVVVGRWSIQAPGLTGPVRLLVLGDLHDGAPEGTDALVRRAAGEDPDLILLVGDMLNGDSPDARRVCALVEGLAPVAPVYYAWGNHELDYLGLGTSSLQTELEGAGAIVLEQSYLDFTVNGAALRLGGLYAYAFALDDFNTCDPAAMDPAVYAFLTEFQATDAYKIILSHRPDSFVLGAAAATWDVDLVVSGHNHGGQVVLPLLGGVFGGDQGYFPTYVHGLYQKEGLTLAITSGLGSGGARLPRLNNPPEMMVLDLLPAG